MVANNASISGAEIRRKLINDLRVRNEDAPTPVPSDRAIRRIMVEFKAAPDTERQPYTYFAWPTAMESGAIPWEASRALLDWLKFRVMGGRNQPPLNRQAAWFWRVTQALPEAPIEKRDMLSYFYTLIDAFESDTARREESRAHFQWEDLVFQGWRSADAKKEYESALKAKTIPRSRFHISPISKTASDAKAIWNKEEIAWILRNTLANKGQEDRKNTREGKQLKGSQPRRKVRRQP